MRGVRKKLEEEEQERWKENYFWHMRERRAKAGLNVLSDVHLCVCMEMCQCVCDVSRGVCDCKYTCMFWQTDVDCESWCLPPPSLYKTPPLKQGKVWSKTTEAKSKGGLCSLQDLLHRFRFSISVIFSVFFSLIPNTPSFSVLFSNSFSFLSLIFKVLRQWEWNTFPMSHWRINIQQSPEVQTGERLRRTAQHQSIMDFLLPFIRFLQWDAMEAPLAQNERRREGRGWHRGSERGGYWWGQKEADKDSKQCQ